MRHIFTLLFAVLAFTACTQNDVEELSANRADVPEILTIGFEGDDTRIQLEAGKTVWTSGDLVSVFYKSDANQQWEYRGETGARVADLYCVDKGAESSRMNYVVVAYPYNPDYIISTASGNIETTLPAVQHYTEESYGVGDNLMVSQSEFTQFSLKSVCGWLKIQLTGNGERVQSITLRGNNEEQLAGLIYVDTATAESTLASEMGSADDNNAGGNLVFDDAIVTELTLDCGEGVELGAEATAFYIALPPQTFEKGFNVEIVCADDTKMVKSSSNNVTIERNHIQPMAAIEFTPSVPNNQIWYTSSDGNVVTPNYADSFGVNIVSNTYIDGEGVITFDTDVTTIGDSAFNSCSSLISVTIPNSVTMIGDYAFAYCFSLTSVTIGDSVTTIGEGAFADCDSLTSVTIPDSVTTIRYAAFLNCDSLTNITIPDSVTTIGSSAFAYCDSLTSVTIPDSVTTIGVNAFYECNSLTSITIPDSVTTIEWGAFADCDSLTSVTIGDSVTTIENYAFNSCDSLTSVYCEATTPPSLGGSDVFYVNAYGRTIYVPAASVEAYKTAEYWSEYADYIIGYDFENGVVVEPEVSINNEIRYTATAKVEAHSSYPWTSDTFGANVVSHEWDSESSEGVITFDADVTTIGKWAFGGCDSLTSITIPYSVTTIGWDAFRSCNSLTSITIPDSVTTIGARAFYSCFSLTNITIPDSVTTIGSSAFAYCTNLVEFNGKFASEDSRCLIVDGTLNSFAPAGLTSYTIPDSVTTIGIGAFDSCSSLTSITIPDSVSTIEAYAFSNCSSLTSIYCEATTPPSFGYDALNTNASERLFYVPTASVETYKTAMFWRDYADYIVGYDFENGVVVEPEVSINNEIRYTATAKVEAKSYFPWTSDTFGANIISNEWYSESGEGVITFDADVTTIGNYAFCECNSLTSLTIPDSVTTIGFCAFANCDSLTCITIPDSVTTIEDYAFCGCDNLTSVTIGNDVTTIGVGVFCECYTLTSVNIPNSITTIGRDAFRSCNSLTSITIPDSVTTIGEWAFGYCDSLTEFRGKYASEDGRCLIIDGVLTSFAPAGLTEYTVPDSIMAIGAVAFAGCNNLTKFRGKYASEDGRCLIIDGTLNAFAPAGITEYTIPNNVTKIGSHAFDGCSLTSITIPDSVTAIGDYAFEGCNSLTSIYCNATTPPSLEGSSVFNSYGSGCRIYVPLESFNIYRFAAGWSRYSAIIASIYPETGEIVEPIPFIGICGTFTGWGVSEDIGMKYLEERNLYVAYGIELNEDDEFKLRKDHGWDYNYGLEYDGAIYTNTYTTLAKNSHNIRVYQTGVYDIYFNADTLMFYLMEQGVDPNDAQYR